MVQVVPHLVHAIFGCATVGRSVQFQTWLALREAKEILGFGVMMLGRSWERQRTNIRRGGDRI